MPNIVTRDETGLRSSKVCCKSFDHLQHLRTVHETLSASSVCSNQISLLCVAGTHLSILCNQSLFSVQVRSRHSSMRIWFPKPWTLPTFTPSRHFPDLSVCTAANVKTLYYTLYSFFGFLHGLPIFLEWQSMIAASGWVHAILNSALTRHRNPLTSTYPRAFIRASSLMMTSFRRASAYYIRPTSTTLSLPTPY